MQKVATVTGAARGIGLGTVKRFLVDGWRVALLDIDEETLNAAPLIYIQTPFYQFAAMLPTLRDHSRAARHFDRGVIGGFGLSRRRPWLSRHTLRKSQMHEKNPLLRPNKRPQNSTLSRRGSR